jgi:hypothetical protein
VVASWGFLSEETQDSGQITVTATVGVRRHRILFTQVL